MSNNKSLGDKLREGTLNLAESDRPDNTILAGLRMIGAIESRPKQFFGFRFYKWFTIMLAKSRGWSEKDIKEALTEGTRIENLY